MSEKLTGFALWQKKYEDAKRRKKERAKRAVNQRAKRLLAAERKRQLKPVGEPTVVKKLVETVKSVGGFITKMYPLTCKGIPDYLVIVRGRVVFIETKGTGKRCTPIQVEMHRVLHEHGVETLVLDRAVDEWDDGVLRYGYKTYADPLDPRWGEEKQTLKTE